MGKAKKAKAKNEVWYKVLAIVIGACLLFGLGALIAQTTGLFDYISLRQTALSTDHYSLNNAQLKYLVYYEYEYYYEYYYNNYASYYMQQYGYDDLDTFYAHESDFRTFLENTTGLNIQKSLSKQKYNGSSESWLDHLKDEAVSGMMQTLLLCEAARENGYELTDEDKQVVDAYMDRIADAARQGNYTFSSYVAKRYGGKGITKGDIRGVVEMQQLASSYSNYLNDSFTYTDEQYNNYFDEHKYDYLKADYYAYTVEADIATGATDDEKTAAISAAKNKAQELFDKIEGGGDFTAVVTEYEKGLAQAELDYANQQLEEAKARADAEAAATDAVTEAATEAETAAETDAETAEDTASDTTGADTEAAPKEEEKAMTVEEATALVTSAQAKLDKITEDYIKETYLKTAQQYKESSKTEADEWIFTGNTATEGDNKLVFNDDSATIYQIVKSVYRDDYLTSTYHALYFQVADFSDNEDAANEYAQKIMNEFKNGTDKSAEAFDKLAETYTTDSITVTATGEQKEKFKISNSSIQDAMVEYNDWMFSGDRKAGDVKAFLYEGDGVALAEDTIYIYYFVENGRVAWLINVDSAMRDADLDSALDGFEDKYPINVNEDAIAKID